MKSFQSQHRLERSKLEEKYTPPPGLIKLILLQVRTHFARPNWKEVFNKIASKHPYSTVGKKFLQPKLQ